MQKFLEKNHKFLVGAIFLLAAFLIFAGLTRADVQTDEAAYSFRALGWFDYMDTSNLQTTPVQWFEEIPAWSKLSFHDAPPLVFAIQHIFFQVFGENQLAIRLPFALAGLGSVILLYFLTRKLYGKNTALLASLILAVLSYHSWASKVGYLEPIAAFFAVLTLYLFILSLRNYKKFIFFGISLGLMMLTKYTTFFVIPVIFIYLLVQKREVFKNKYFWLSLLTALVIILPVVFYNVKVFQTRGHFDLQFSKLLGQDISQDWPGLVKGEGKTEYLSQAVGTWRLTQVMSLPMYLLLLASLVYLILGMFKRELRDGNLLLFLLTVFLTVTFSFIGNAVRFLSILNPFIALTIAVFLVKIMDKTSSAKAVQVYLVYTIIAAVLVLEIFYNINTNLLENPVGQPGKHYSSYRFERGGFEPLENYLLANTTIGSSTRKNIVSFDDILLNPEEDLTGEDVVVFDPNLSWFSTLWYFRRFAIYNSDLLISAADMASAIPVDQWPEFFRSVGAKDFYYIRGKNQFVFDPGSVNNGNQNAAGVLEEYLSSLGSEVIDINNANGQLAFQIYKLTLN